MNNSPNVFVFLDNEAFSKLPQAEKLAYLARAAEAVKTGVLIVTPAKATPIIYPPKEGG